MCEWFQSEWIVYRTILFPWQVYAFMPYAINLNITDSIWEFLVSLQLGVHQNHLDGLWKYRFLGPRNSDAVDLRWNRSGVGLRIGISNKFLGDAGVLVQEPCSAPFQQLFKNCQSDMYPASHYCISLIINEIEHLFIFLSHLCLFSCRLSVHILCSFPVSWFIFSLIDL